jgi:ABC-type polysaccharide/polyol phosphate export permease
VASAAEIWSYRGLIWNLTQRELKVKYKRSLLGRLWSLINPAATLAIYTVVFGTFLKVTPPVAGNGHTKAFALFLFCALVVWNFFSQVLSGAMVALVAAGPLLKKVYFPAECPVVANAASVLTQTTLEVFVLLLFMVIVGNVSWTFLLLPVLIAFLFLFTLGVGLVLSLLNVYFRDVGYLVAIMLNLLFYATPIIYPFSIIPEKVGVVPARTIITLNPLTQFAGAARDLTYHLQLPSTGRIIGIVTVSTVVFVGGWRAFSRYAHSVSEEL